LAKEALVGNFVQRIGDLIFTIALISLIVIATGYRESPQFSGYLALAISSLITGLLIALFGRMATELTQIRTESEKQTAILENLLSRSN
jgi:divalent metal cation (Fe/Co/Zn/Cd) transporter